MPQAVAYVAAAATAALTGGTIAGVSAAVAAGTLSLGATLIYGAVEVGLYAGLSLAINALFGPKPPAPAQVQNPLKSGFAPRRSGYGRARTSGTYALFEAQNKVAYQVMAMHDGYMDGWERYFLHDDEVDVDAGTGGVWCPSDTRKYAYGGPPGDRVFIETRQGLPVETVFARPAAGLPTIWTATHRGDHLASLSLTCKQSKAKYQQEDFPNGLPIPSAVGRFQPTYDPRDGAQTPPSDTTVAFEDFLNIARATWLWTDNPVLALMSYLTVGYGGMGLSWTQYIEPAIDDWIAAADDCDVLMALAAGGTEKRYRMGGLYNHDTDPAEVVGQMLATFDGWLGQRGDGALTVKPGRYIAPTVTLTDDHIIGYSVQHFLPDEQSVNEVVPSYTEPNKYQTNDAGAWRDEADIAARGVVRSKALDYGWVQSKSQARRLGKRVLNRSLQELRGTVTANFFGFSALGERFLTLQISEHAALNNLVVEVTRIEMDLTGLALNIEWIAADPNIDDWTTAEETANTTGAARLPGDLLTAPTITVVTPFYEQASAADTGARLQISVSAPVTEDVEWLVRWRVHGLSPAAFWHEGTYSDVADGAAVVLVTGFVPAHDVLDVEVAYSTAGQISPWSAAYTVTTAAPIDVFVDTLGGVLTPGAGTTITDNGDGTITIATDASVKPTESLEVACSDELTALTAGTGKVTFRMPYAFTLTAVRASLTTAQASGSIFTVDINEAGTTILSTLLTIDNTEKTSTTAATAAVISDASLADDAEMTVDIDQIGDGSAKGLKVILIGHRT